MKIVQAIKLLLVHEEAGRTVFTKKDLLKILRTKSENEAHETIQRLVKEKALRRAVKGVYVNSLRPSVPVDTLEMIAKAMRRGHHSYVSLESALSEYGVISQIPFWLIAMTTGRQGEYDTPFGAIEFFHTSKRVDEILDGTIDTGRPLRLAKKWTAYHDLERVGRSLDLIDHEVLREESAF